MRIILPSGGTARVSKHVQPETIKALDEMVQAATKARPGRRYTALSYKCKIGRHTDCTAKHCQCDCGHLYNP